MKLVDIQSELKNLTVYGTMTSGNDTIMSLADRDEFTSIIHPHEASGVAIS